MTPWEEIEDGASKLIGLSTEPESDKQPDIDDVLLDLADIGETEYEDILEISDINLNEDWSNPFKRHHKKPKQHKKVVHHKKPKQHKKKPKKLKVLNCSEL